MFARLFPGRRFGGGTLSVYIEGRPVVDVWTGWSDRAGEVPWTADTGAMVFSATKGVASTVIHRLVDRELLCYDTPVADYWPEFGANGKADITVRDVLRHRSGLSHLKGVSKTELMDHRLMEERLAAAPVDHLRGAPAYHALTYGWLLSGLARSVTGMGMRELVRTELAQPLNTDGLHLGRPPAGAPTKVAQILAPQSNRPNPVFNFVAPRVAGLPFSGALGAMYFPGIKSFVQGDIPFLDGEVPAANGVVTGRGLAKMYAALANDGRIDGTQFLSSELVNGLTGKPRVLPDLNIMVPMPFHLGYHESPIPGLLKGFGHIGLGGTLGWADPQTASAFGLCPQPAADTDGVRHGVVRGPGPSAAQCHHCRPARRSPRGAAVRRNLRPSQTAKAGGSGAGARAAPAAAVDAGRRPRRRTAGGCCSRACGECRRRPPERSRARSTG